MNTEEQNITPKQAISKRIGEFFKRLWQAIQPLADSWKGASLALIITAVLVLLIELTYQITPGADPLALLFLLVALGLAAFLAGMSSHLLRGMINAIPKQFLWAICFAMPIFGLLIISRLSTGAALGLFLAAFVLAPALLGGGLHTLIKGDFKSLKTYRKVLNLTGLVLGAGAILFTVWWLIQPGTQPDAQVNAAMQSDAVIAQIDLPNPSQPGSYTVQTLTYGSGTDKQRTEFAEGAAFTSPTVDGTPFLNEWEGPTGWYLKRYWGFDPTELPLNGRVWYPESEGSFPLLLIVHGNHTSEDYSDPGYDYLGELLASRGIITVSVDQNFLNGNWTSLFGSKANQDENDARGWMLLEHLKQWEQWNNQSEHPFYGKVDMDSIALIGHSRGGEAVSEAAAFNNLPFYPDDATIPFDYHFNIQSVIAIAPVDNQYSPAGKPTPIENVNYLVLHGSNDGDVSSFAGQATYQRLTFTDSGNWLKAAVYIGDANHGQFNTTWGSRDTGGFSNTLLNRKALLPAEEQQQIAKVYISAFLESTLNGEKGYLPLFEDARHGDDWLPDTIFLSQYEDNHTQVIADFEEDVNVSTPSIDGSITTRNLTKWYEGVVRGKWYNQQDTSAVFLGWNNAGSEKTASYTIQFDNAELTPTADSVLTFSMADANQDHGGDDEEMDKEETKEEKKDDKEEEEESQPIDLTIAVETPNGMAELPLSHFAMLQPQVKASVLKADFLSDQADSEIVFQTFAFPLVDFLAANPVLDPAKIEAVHFIFDRTKAGVIVLDDVSLRKK